MRRTRFLIAYTFAWLPLLALYAAALMVSLPGRPGVLLVIGTGVVSVLPAALLGLGIWWMTARLIARAMPPARMLLAHTLGSVLFSVLWSGVILLQIGLSGPREAVDAFMVRALPWQLLIGVGVYGVVAGVATTVHVSAKLREREAAAARADALRARAELQALRARLDPHFLFNTLHSILALIRQRPASAEDALERLAGLLRYVLDAQRGGSEDASLADELAFTRAYLALEQLRLGDRLRVVEEIDEEALDCALPVLTLQPLVENAVRHGIAPLAGGATLYLRAVVRPDAGGVERLQVEIEDDGAGPPASPDETNGIGLAAVRQRLHLRFPHADVQLRTPTQGGFSVAVNVPAEPFGPRPRATERGRRSAASLVGSGTSR